MLFDAHVHLCPKGTLKKLKRLTPCPSLPGYTKAQENPWEHYRRLAIQKGIYKALVMPFPFKELIQLVPSAANEYVCQAVERNPDLFLGLGLIHESASYLDSLRRYIVGVKDHFYITFREPLKKYFPAYDFLQQSNLVLMVHPEWKERVTRIREIKKNFPHLKVILAHAGRKGLYTGEGVIKVARDLKEWDSLFFEISTIRVPEVIRKLVNLVGSERVLFGSDFPYYCHSRNEDVYSCEMSAVEKAQLSEQEYANVFCNTFKYLFLSGIWIRRVCKQDKNALMTLIQGISSTERKFLALQRKEKVIRQCIDKERHIWVAETDGEIIGFIRESDRSQGGALVEEIYIKPAHRRKGYAKRLLDTLMAIFDRLEMKTYGDNTPICNLARQAGFCIERFTPKRTLVTWKWVRR